MYGKYNTVWMSINHNRPLQKETYHILLSNWNDAVSSPAALFENISVPCIYYYASCTWSDTRDNYCTFTVKLPLETWIGGVIRRLIVLFNCFYISWYRPLWIPHSIEQPPCPLSLWHHLSTATMWKTPALLGYMEIHRPDLLTKPESFLAVIGTFVLTQRVCPGYWYDCPYYRPYTRPYIHSYTRPYVEGGSMVARILATSDLWADDMCWVMCTMESMATSGFTWIRLKTKGGQLAWSSN